MALGAAGLATALGVAQIAAQPDDEDALARALTQQRVQAGQTVNPADAIEHQAQALTADQMLTLVNGYEQEMDKSLVHVETVRLGAYRQKDIIRIACIDDKLGQIREVINLVKPRLVTIQISKRDDLRLRGQFSLIQQARERVQQLSVDVENCLGDVLDIVSVGKIGEETPPSNATDPTRPQDPGVVIDRPTEASTWQ